MRTSSRFTEERMAGKSLQPAICTRAVPVVGGVLAAAIILGFSTRYGIFRDELYYWVCARRLSWGYVDHPPFSVFVLHFFGDHVWALKLPAAVAFGLAVFLMGRQARTMGAGSWGAGATTLVTALCPLLAAVAGLYSMNVLEIAFWAIATTLTARLLVNPDLWSWLVLGIVIGLGVLNKYSMLLLPAGLGVGLLVTRARRQLLTPWPWVAMFLAVAIVSPHALWEIRHGQPSLEFIRNATNVKMASIGPLDFVTEQLVDTNPVFAMCWLSGLGGLLFSRRLAAWRAHGIAFLVSAAVLIASGTSRASYLAPSYALLLPAGGVMLERLVPVKPIWARRLVLAVLVLAGLATLPLALPVLSPERLIAYERAIGFRPRAEERFDVGPLPQFMADRFGWQNMAAAVERAYRDLSPQEQARTWVFTRNYGEAAAIEYFSPELRGKVLSGHNNYWLWFPDGWDGSEALVIGDTREDVQKAFGDVTEVGQTDHPLAMPYERHLPIYLARQPTQSLETLRAAIKHFD